MGDALGDAEGDGTAAERKRGHHRTPTSIIRLLVCFGLGFHLGVGGTIVVVNRYLTLRHYRRHHCLPQSQTARHTTQPNSISVVVVTCGYDESANNIFARTPQTIRNTTHTHARSPLSRKIIQVGIGLSSSSRISSQCSRSLLRSVPLVRFTYINYR